MAKKRLFTETERVDLASVVGARSDVEAGMVMIEAMGRAMNEVRAKMERLGASADPDRPPVIAITFEAVGVLN